MVKKTSQKSLNTARHVEAVQEATPSKKWPPLFSKDVTKEDKIALLSFCLGMVVMTCFFILDLQIRNTLETQRVEERVLASLNRATLIQKQAGVTQAKPKRTHRPTTQVQKQAPVQCPPVWNRQATFNPEEYAPYDTVGTLTLSGNVCSVLPAGTKCPEHITVFINPQTTYSKEWWTKHWAGTHAISKTDPRALKYNKRVWADTNGAFTFEALPAGAYYIGAEVAAPTPQKPCQRVRVGAEVILDQNKTVNVRIVSPK